MSVLFFSADRIFDGTRFLPEGTILVTTPAGEVVQLLGAADAPESVRRLHGILLPGLINSHCHLELSHFKGLIPEGIGLTDFLIQVVARRRETWMPGHQLACAHSAAAEMQASGIVAVGDICNTADALPAKAASPLQWRQFIEVLCFTNEAVPERMAHNQALLAAHLAAGFLQSNLTPHAPYSVSAGGFAALNTATAGKTVSVHNQETAAEDELFLSGTGALLSLFERTGNPTPVPTGKSSLQTWLPYFTNGQTLLLVHNSFTRHDDVLFAKTHAEIHGLRLFWCLCPGANHYIERTLPPLQLLLDENCSIVLGTDSYSSNRQLSIAAEIKLLHEGFPQVPLERLLAAATASGAAALGCAGLGSFKKGTTPGLALLHLDAQGQITGTSERVL